MTEIDQLVNATALRAYVNEEDLAGAVKELIETALRQKMYPHVINIECADDYEQTGEYHVVLWADSMDGSNSLEAKRN